MKNKMGSHSDKGLSYKKTRVLYVTDDTLDLDCCFSDFIKKLFYLNSISNTEPIVICLNSYGGCASKMCAIIDAVQAIEAPVHTQCIGVAASAACVVLAIGEKGQRYASPLARMMLHQPNAVISGDATQVEIERTEMKSLFDSITEIIAQVTEKTARVIKKNISRDKWMSAEESKTYGIIDHIGVHPFISCNITKDIQEKE